MSEEKKKTLSKATLCWCCAKAVGGCNWSDNFRSVKGWEVIPTKKEIYGGASYNSCIVLNCPEFKRDAYKDGLVRAREDDANESTLQKT